jgi:hypothetical protein
MTQPITLSRRGFLTGLCLTPLLAPLLIPKSVHAEIQIPRRRRIDLGLQTVSMDQLVLDDSFNVRGEMPAHVMWTLKEHIKQHGILSPLIGVRKRRLFREDKVAIVCGFRRYAAAKSLGLTSLPVDVGDVRPHTPDPYARGKRVVFDILYGNGKKHESV